MYVFVVPNEERGGGGSSIACQLCVCFEVSIGLIDTCEERKGEFMQTGFSSAFSSVLMKAKYHIKSLFWITFLYLVTL